MKTEWLKFLLCPWVISKKMPFKKSHHKGINMITILCFASGNDKKKKSKILNNHSEWVFSLTRGHISLIQGSL